MAFTGDGNPITGLCVVEQTCPPGYVMIDKCQDNHRSEADLWKDNIFSKKVKRFFCYTRVFPLDGGRLNNVLVDMAVGDERDPTPSGFTQMTRTQDNNEPAFKRKQIFVKLVPRNQASDAINDIIFLSKQRRAPSGYTLVPGDMNGMMLCYKVGPVQPSSSGQPPALPPRPTFVQQPAVTSNPLPYPMVTPQLAAVQGTANDGSYMSSGIGQQPISNNHMPVRQMSKVHPLSGVPFELNPKFSSTSQEWAMGDVHTKSRSEIFAEFNYEFNFEHQAVSTSQNFR